MKKLSSQERVAFSLAAVMTALFLSAAILAVSLLIMLSGTENALYEYKTNSEIKLSDLSKKKKETEDRIAELESNVELAERTRNELERKIAQTEGELSEIKSSLGSTDALYKSLNAQLTSLKKELEVKKSEIDALKKELEGLKATYGTDINKQYELLLKLNELLENPPVIEITPPSYDENGTLIDEGTYRKAKVSLYYEDLTRGYFFRYNENEIYPSSGCIEEAFALSVLKAASSEQAEYEKKLAEYIATNGPTDSLPDFVFKYDLEKIFTYTSDKALGGSGIIKDGEFGAEYTYYELFSHLVKYGDAVAYKELKGFFGTTLQKNLLASIGAQSMKGDPTLASAKELSLIMKEIYSFVESDAYYAELLKDSMIGSVHSVMITPGIVGKDVAHAYGWSEGAYHDMAIVYDSNPYVLVFASDMDQGGDEINAYINKIASLIDDIHESFYK